MAVHLDREHYIPIRVTDLIDFLCDGKGAVGEKKALPLPEATEFRRFSLTMGNYYHQYFYPQLQRLKDAYSSFDPDSETVSLVNVSEEERQKIMDQLFADMRILMEKGNFVHLDRAEMMKVMEGASLWGLEMDVCWYVCDRLEMYFRCDGLGKRTIRRWWKFWKKEEIEVPEYNRLLIMLKQKPHKRLAKHADVKNLFIKLFKDMPKNDLEMVLPGTRVRMSRIDKGLIYYPLAMGFAICIYAILTQVFGWESVLIKLFGAFAGGVALTWSLAVGFAGYAYRSYYTYTVKKTAYSLRLTESLYYQSLGSNGGIFHLLMDEGEEQEIREVLLAYYYLWRYGGSEGMQPMKLDDQIEEDFEKRLNLKVDFEIDDALTKLEQLGLMERVNNLCRVIPIGQATDKLTALASKLMTEAEAAKIASAKSLKRDSDEKSLLESLKLETMG